MRIQLDLGYRYRLEMIDHVIADQIGLMVMSIEIDSYLMPSTREPCSREVEILSIETSDLHIINEEVGVASCDICIS